MEDVECSYQMETPFKVNRGHRKFQIYTYRYSRAVSNVKFSEIIPCKLLSERSLHEDIHVIQHRRTLRVYLLYMFIFYITNTHMDIILVMLPPVSLHFTPSQAHWDGKHGSPIQFFLIPYSSLIAIRASTSVRKENKMKFQQKCLNNCNEHRY